jgi:hypothetical protein
MLFAVTDSTSAVVAGSVVVGAVVGRGAVVCAAAVVAGDVAGVLRVHAVTDSEATTAAATFKAGTAETRLGWVPELRELRGDRDVRSVKGVDHRGIGR